MSNLFIYRPRYFKYALISSIIFLILTILSVYLLCWIKFHHPAYQFASGVQCVIFAMATIMTFLIAMVEKSNEHP